MGPFATAQEFAEYTGLPYPTEFLARWQSVLQMAADLIRGFCGQTLSIVENDTVDMGPIASPTLVLPEHPITSVSIVLAGGAAVTDYWVDPNRRLLHRGTILGVVGAPWTQGATVTYSHGYAEDTYQYGQLRTMSMEMADRALRSAEAPASFEPSEEAIGWRTRLFLDEGQKMRLVNFGAVLVG
jgi:hypothetical protein